jgi:hypothetical protein
MDEIEDRRESWLERRDRTPQTFLLHSGEEGAVMPKTSFAACALVLFPLVGVMLSPLGKVAAGPPERVSGKMVIDEVSEGLRRYRQTSDENRRVDWLRRLAPTRDPRVALAMGEYVCIQRNPFPQQISVAWLLTQHFMPSPPDCDDMVEQIRVARRWWELNEADLRRRAKQLPR